MVGQPWDTDFCAQCAVFAVACSGIGQETAAELAKRGAHGEKEVHTVGSAVQQHSATNHAQLTTPAVHGGVSTWSHLPWPGSPDKPCWLPALAVSVFLQLCWPAAARARVMR
jgi:hypothetical protein